MDVTNNKQKEAMTETENVEEEVHPLVGVPNLHIDANGEQIVYERDDEGNVVGWHKEIPNG